MDDEQEVKDVLVLSSYEDNEDLFTGTAYEGHSSTGGGGGRSRRGSILWPCLKLNAIPLLSIALGLSFIAILLLSIALGREVHLARHNSTTIIYINNTYPPLPSSSPAPSPRPTDGPTAPPATSPPPTDAPPTTNPPPLPTTPAPDTTVPSPTPTPTPSTSPPSPSPSPLPPPPPPPSPPSYQELVIDEVSRDMLSAMDLTINPCDDFYQYACGMWINTTKLPNDRGSWTKSFSVIEENNEIVLKKILEEGWPVIGTWFNNCMDARVRDKIGVAPLNPFLNKIANMSSNLTDIMSTIGYLQKLGSNVLFDLYVDPDFFDPTTNIADLSQGGLSLPSRKYYLKSDNTSATIRTQFFNHINNTFNILNITVPAGEAQSIFDFEKTLASFSMDEEDMRDPYAIYHKIGAQGLIEISPLPWDSYFDSIGTSIEAIGENLNVEDIDYITNLTQLITSATRSPMALAQLQSYLRWRVISAYGTILTSDLEDEFYSFRSIIYGIKESPPMWRKCLSSTSYSLGGILGRYYILKQFGGNSKIVAQSILNGIADSMRSLLEVEEWMDQNTREIAVEKLDAITSKIGFPDVWPNYASLFVAPGDYFGNNIEYTKLEVKKELEKIGKPVDKAEWFMDVFDVNAYYNPLNNEIVFPAGILQGSFFNESFPPELNYGGIGMVMGHEITHGFDDSGAQFDKNGKLVQWWPQNVIDAFNNKTECVVNQYNQYQEVGLNINGELTLGENIADIGGLKESFFAYRNASDNTTSALLKKYFNMTSDQVFFLAFAQTWCSVSSPQYEYWLITTNPHAPPKFRVNGPVSDLPQFAEAYNCPSGSNLNPPTADVCTVW